MYTFETLAVEQNVIWPKTFTTGKCGFGLGGNYDPGKIFPTEKCTNVTLETLAVERKQVGKNVIQHKKKLYH